MIWGELSVLLLAVGLVALAFVIFWPEPKPLDAGKHRAERRAVDPEPAAEPEPGEDTQRLRWYDEPSGERPLYPS